MTAPVRLASEEATRALEILQQELFALRPSARQLLVYRLLQWDVAALGVALVAALVTTITQGERSTLANLAFGLLGLTGLVMFPLFLLNLGLVRRLWRVAKMRRRLGLAELLEAAFKAQRRKARVRNLLTAVLVIVGLVFVLGGAVAIVMIPNTELGSLGKAVVVAFYLALGVPLASLHFLRRGMERLTVVDRLHSTLSAAVSDLPPGQDKSIALSPRDYELIARIERAQVIAERYQSIRQSGHGADTSGYAVQMSFAAQQAKSQLPGPERVRVDEQVLRLMEDPERTGVVKDAQSALRRLPVPNTSAEIVFDVDRGARRVRVVRIVTPSVHQLGDTKRGT
ncbi:MAG: hypothetical protein ACREMV_09305 [Gemmatimonadales bacterium]